MSRESMKVIRKTNVVADSSVSPVIDLKAKLLVNKMELTKTATHLEQVSKNLVEMGPENAVSRSGELGIDILQDVVRVRGVLQFLDEIS